MKEINEGKRIERLKKAWKASRGEGLASDIDKGAAIGAAIGTGLGAASAFGATLRTGGMVSTAGMLALAGATVGSAVGGWTGAGAGAVYHGAKRVINTAKEYRRLKAMGEDVGSFQDYLMNVEVLDEGLISSWKKSSKEFEDEYQQNVAAFVKKHGGFKKAMKKVDELGNQAQMGAALSGLNPMLGAGIAGSAIGQLPRRAGIIRKLGRTIKYAMMGENVENINSVLAENLDDDFIDFVENATEEEFNLMVKKLEEDIEQENIQEEDNEPEMSPGEMMIAATLDGKPHKVQEIFDAAVRAKAAEIVDDYKAMVASEMFNPPEDEEMTEETEEEEDEDYPDFLDPDFAHFVENASDEEFDELESELNEGKRLDRWNKARRRTDTGSHLGSMSAGFAIGNAATGNKLTASLSAGVAAAAGIHRLHKINKEYRRLKSIGEETELNEGERWNRVKTAIQNTSDHADEAIYGKRFSDNGFGSFMAKTYTKGLRHPVGKALAGVAAIQLSGTASNPAVGGAMVAGGLGALGAAVVQKGYRVAKEYRRLKKLGEDVGTFEDFVLTEMRKETDAVTKAFLNGQKKKGARSHTDGTNLYLHGNHIGKREGGDIHLSMAGWGTKTTRDRLNGVLEHLGHPHRFSQKGGVQHFGNKPVDTKAWININKIGE